MKLIPAAILVIMFSSCKNSVDLSDAYGNFESTEVTVSSESTGRILKLNIEEGQQLTKGQHIGLIDTTDLYLKYKQLLAQKKATNARYPTITGQIDVQEQQKKNLMIEKDRIQRLLNDQAATQKQMDDINGSIRLADRQIESIKTQNAGIEEEAKVINTQIAQVLESIHKCYLEAPCNGTVLEKFAEPGEEAMIGKPLFKLADLSEMELRVYVSGAQLQGVKIGQKVDVLIDKDSKNNLKLEGEVSWISSKAEFTPKIIQTKEERVNLVYAMKVRVKNDGSIKIAMPGEVNFLKK